jgi:RNA polymerase sigma factor (sigma-70 family)
MTEGLAPFHLARRQSRVMTVSNSNSQQLLQRYQDGQSEAAAAIFDRYVARLIALVRSRIGPKLRRRVDPEDVVQSAYRSFFIHAKDEKYQLTRSGDLWRLLASITLNKLHGQLEKHTAAKRSIDREAVADVSLANFKAPNHSGSEEVAIVEQLQLAIDGLSADERTVVTSRLQGQSIVEISSSISKSERTVRRLLAQAKRHLEQRLLTDDVPVITARKKTPNRFTEPHAPLLYSTYVLEQLLGAGGMGKVYRAIEKSTGRIVAV